MTVGQEAEEPSSVKGRAGRRWLARVQVSLRSTPPGAEVFVGDRAYGTTPAEVEWVGEQAAAGREVTIRFVKAGFRPTSVTRTLDGSTSIEVNADLSPIVVARPASSTPMSSGSTERPVGRVNGYLDSPY